MSQKPGPPPTPTKILQLRGSWRGDEEGRAEEPQPVFEKPTVPTWLPKGRPRNVFKSLATQLYEMGVLGKVDQGALARYALTFHRWLSAEEYIEEHGSTWIKRGRPTDAEPDGPIIAVNTFPQVRHAKGYQEALTRLEDRLGLTASARARLRVEHPRGQDGGAKSGGKERHFRKRLG